MPLNKYTTRIFHRRLYATEMESIRFLKSGDNQNQGTVVAYILYDCRRSQITKQGETLDGDMVSDHYTVWHIPRIELDRVGIPYINPTDQIEQVEGVEAGTMWVNESTNMIDVKLFANHVCVACRMLNDNNLQ